MAGGMDEANVDRVVFGGPMMGIAVPKIDIPVMKGTSGITVMTKRGCRRKRKLPLYQMRGCVKACPMYLQPFQLYLYSSNRLYDRAVDEGLMDCMECGSCSYVCPANIDLVKSFKLAKKVYRALKGGAKK